ncbi:MAG: hypothetical protein H7844_11865 [Nitrospirae bacterium YQR-1]
MLSNGSDNPPNLTESDFVIFSSISGGKFAALTEDVLEMLSLEAGIIEPEAIIYFDEILGLTESQTASKAFVVKTTGGNRVLAVKDFLEIETIRADSISPLPAILEKHIRFKSIWAVAFKADEPLLLIDLKKLISEIKEVSN